MIKPFGQRILVKMDAQSESKIGDIIIATSNTEKPNSGTIVDFGFAIDPIDCDLNLGDSILLPKDAGVEVEHEFETFVIIELHEILATVPKV